MTTYKGLPGPHICDFWTREDSAANYDDGATRIRARPVHTILLRAEIPICEHMTGPGRLPDDGFRFSAVPPKVAGMGTFPVSPYAVLD